MRRTLPMIGVAAIAVVIALAVVTGCTKSEPTPASGAPPSAVPAPSVDAGAGETATCPVTGETMAKADMIPVTYKGKTYYLCCADCKPKFEADPEKYLSGTAEPPAEPMMHHNDGNGADEDAEHD